MKTVSVTVLFLVTVVTVSAQVKYVWDLLKPPTSTVKVAEMMAAAIPGETYPVYSDIPTTSFTCSGKPGFFADVDAKCQVFHRCDINGNLTSYLCVNTTVFNQIDLICDYWFNVDCARSPEFVDFANSRLYTDKMLFDTPPADYVPPSAPDSDSSDSQPAPKSMPAPAKAKKAAAPAKAPAPPAVKGKAAPAAAVTTATTTTAAPTDAPTDAATDAPADAAATDAPAADTDATDAPSDVTDAPTDAPTTTAAPTTTKAAAKKVIASGRAVSSGKSKGQS